MMDDDGYKWFMRNTSVLATLTGASEWTKRTYAFPGVNTFAPQSITLDSIETGNLPMSRWFWRDPLSLLEDT